MSTAEFSLNDRLASTEGLVAMSGIEAVVRIPLDQHRADAVAGLRTAGLVCGYRGSPVGGMDQVYERNRAILEANDIRFINGVNEDLGATAVWGSQLASLEPNPTFDGVLGMWYGKGPGVDRSGDAFRHANASGVSPNGGVLAIAGDDPSNKSSTVPSASEWALADQAMPTLFPGNVQEVLDFGRFGYEMSRFCGAWVAMKFVTNVADGYMTVDPNPDRITILPTTFEVDGQPWRPSQSDQLLGAESLRLETELFTNRLAAAQAFVAAQSLDRTIGATGPAKLGIVAAGTCYYEMIDALGRLGLTSMMLAELGIRIYKPAMIWPLEPTGLTAFATDVDELLVIEEKRAFIETQVRDILYGRADAPRVLGKTDEEGLPLVKMSGALVSDDLVAPLRRRLNRIVPEGTLTAERIRIPVTITSTSSPTGDDEDLPNRIPHFCSGCPHNRSTVVPEGSKVGGGIGCHSMTMWMDRGTVGLTQMGGEGAQWVGMEPFIDDRHRFQNLGDGTFAHSGSLAIRQAVSAGTNITYKLLYNSTVAMTGGQEAAGDMPVPQITRWLEAEGVTQSVVVAAEPDRYGADADWAENTRVEHRDKLDEVQLELRDVSGTTVLIYDQECAAELRRGRKRGTKVTPTTRVMIDQAICEGCGDCGEVSNCASVHPVMTPFGRKTEIHQESCNFDLTCLEGNCPAFVSIEIDPTYRPAKAVETVPPGDLPSDPTVPDRGSLVFVGIGGTGVVTMSQVVSTAALLDGRATNSLDQTGLAQKGGTVVSNLRIFGPDEDGGTPESSNFIGDGEATALLLFDLVSGISPSILDRASPDRTVAVVSSALIPTGAMVSGRGAERFPELARFRQAIDPVTRSSDNLWLDAGGIAQRIFSSQPLANALLLGVAYQKGLVPVSGASIEKAIELNGVAVDRNLEAFRLGRRLASDDDLLAQLEDPGSNADTPPRLSGKAAAIAASIESDDELADVLAWRIPELIDYQDAKYAQKYADKVKLVRSAEVRLTTGCSDLSQTVARHLYKLMAYKDEYEVARLAMKSDIADQARARFGPDAKVSYRLQPPSMKVVGYDKKIAVPETAGRKMFAGLVKTKRLRGTRIDPFGQTEERRIERQLIDEYRGLIDTLLAKLTADNYEQAVRIADLADQIRGYDTVKLGNVDRYRSALAAALADWK